MKDHRSEFLELESFRQVQNPTQSLLNPTEFSFITEQYMNNIYQLQNPAHSSGF